MLHDIVFHSQRSNIFIAKNLTISGEPYTPNSKGKCNFSASVEKWSCVSKVRVAPCLNIMHEKVRHNG
jgi:hypothetical protein